MCPEHLLSSVHPLGGGPGTKVVEPGDTQPLIQTVVGGDPLIQLYKVLLPVNMTWRGGPLSGNQTFFGGFRRVTTLNSLVSPG